MGLQLVAFRTHQMNSVTCGGDDRRAGLIYLLMQTAGLELVLRGLELVADGDLGRGLDVVVEQHREAHLRARRGGPS